MTWPYSMHLVGRECRNTAIKSNQPGDVLRCSVMSRNALTPEARKARENGHFEASLAASRGFGWNSAAHIGQAMSYSELRLQYD